MAGIGWLDFSNAASSSVNHVKGSLADVYVPLLTTAGRTDRQGRLSMAAYLAASTPNGVENINSEKGLTKGPVYSGFFGSKTGKVRNVLS
jgi:hypothetical protein